MISEAGRSSKSIMAQTLELSTYHAQKLFTHFESRAPAGRTRTRNHTEGDTMLLTSPAHVSISSASGMLPHFLILLLVAAEFFKLLAKSRMRLNHLNLFCNALRLAMTPLWSVWAKHITLWWIFGRLGIDYLTLLFPCFSLPECSEKLRH